MSGDPLFHVAIYGPRGASRSALEAKLRKALADLGINALPRPGPAGAGFELRIGDADREALTTGKAKPKW